MDIIDNRGRIVRETSIDSYRQLVASGTLAGDLDRVYKCLLDTGPRTRNEVARTTGIQPNDCSARLGVLVRGFTKPLVVELGKYKCPISQKNITLYDVTSNVGERVPDTGQKRKVQKDVTIKNCSECPMLQEESDDSVRCWIDDEVVPDDVERPKGCKMNKYNYRLIGG